MEKFINYVNSLSENNNKEFKVNVKKTNSKFKKNIEKILAQYNLKIDMNNIEFIEVEYKNILFDFVLTEKKELIPLYNGDDILKLSILYELYDKFKIKKNIIYNQLLDKLLKKARIVEKFSINSLELNLNNQISNSVNDIVGYMVINNKIKLPITIKEIFDDNIIYYIEELSLSFKNLDELKSFVLLYQKYSNNIVFSQKTKHFN